MEPADALILASAAVVDLAALCFLRYWREEQERSQRLGASLQLALREGRLGEPARTAEPPVVEKAA